MEIEIRNVFARRLEALRKQRGKSRMAVSQLAGLHDTAVYEYENKARTPTLDSAVKLAKYFGVSVDYLTGR